MTSPRTARRLSRLLSMVPWVIANPGATVNEVCERFGYTSRELAADLNMVLVCGLPGYGPGDLMYAHIDEGEVVIDTADYFARPVRLTAAEALMMLAGGMAVLSSGAAPPALASAVEKLQRVVGPEPESLAVDLAPEPDALHLLREASSEGKVVRLVYTSLGANVTTQRDVEPHAVFSTMGNWYLTGHCRLAGDQRTFRVDRIREAAPTGDAFEPPESPPEPGVRYTPGVDDVAARIHLGPDARWVAEYYPVEIVAEDAEGLVVDFSSADPLVAARLLLRLGTGAALLEGDEVAEARDELRSRMLARYR